MIALANWTPDGFIGRLFQTVGTHRPPPAGVASPALWGTETPPARQLFGDGIADLSVERRHFVFRYRSVDHFLDVFRTYYGPVLTAFESLDDAGREALAADLRQLLTEMNTADGYLAIPAAYLQVAGHAGGVAPSPPGTGPRRVRHLPSAHDTRAGGRRDRGRTRRGLGSSSATSAGS